MLTKRDIVIVVDAYSIGCYLAPAFLSRGYHCAHVRSTDDVASFYLQSFRSSDFILDTLYKSDNQIKEEFGSWRVLCVLAGCEFGVELAAHLAEVLGAPERNDPDKAVLWRDKFQMHEALGSAGIPSMRYRKADDPGVLIDWINSLPCPYPVVLKPLRSACTDNVHICTNLEEVNRSFCAIQATKNLFGEANREVLAQEYLRSMELPWEVKRTGEENYDVEYCVNTVSRRGLHYISEIIKCYRRRYGDLSVHDFNRLLCPVEHQRSYEALSSYVFSVLDALGLENGPAHNELMVVDGRPVLLETAARLPGSVDMSAYAKALGYSQLDLFVLSIANPAEYNRYVEQPRAKLRLNSSCVFLISDEEGPIVSPPEVGAWRSLDTFHSLSVQSSGMLRRTTTLADSPGFVFLLSEHPMNLARDREAIRNTEGDVYRRMLRT